MLVDEDLKDVFKAHASYIQQLGTVDSLTIGGMDDVAPKTPWLLWSTVPRCICLSRA